MTIKQSAICLQYDIEIHDHQMHSRHTTQHI